MKRATKEEWTLVANTIRGLAMDGVQAANSGHPGMPMGMADVAAVLFLDHLAHCPTRPDWVNRDRFVLSGGHGSMLLYSLLHLSGYDLPLAELKAFRQWDSKTPGHPEYGHTPGVETTTGPLGQGCGNAVGMALAERMLAARLNSEATTLIDHYTYAMCGDGDLMEGISHEVFSLAGHLGLNKLVLFYDSNRITIEGSTDLAYRDDVKRRFQGYRWNVQEIDGHDYDAIDRAIRKARRSADAPTLVICRTHIAHGSPNMHDNPEAHGAPLGAAEVRATKLNLGLPADEAFHVPAAVRALFAARLTALQRKAAKWERARKAALAADAGLATRWNEQFGPLPADLDQAVPAYEAGAKIATRSASGKVIQTLAKALPRLVGGSADLAPSNKSLISGAASVAPGSFAGRNLHFGVREHGMAAILNGMALHGGFTVYGATFFVFADYCRPSMRLAALMKLPIVYVMTHDSFYVGEDGPTHEPIEQLASLRAMPNMTMIRPADATETSAAWVAAIRNQAGPTCLLLTRQDLPVIDRKTAPAARELEKGAYTLWQRGPGIPDVIVIASGSEVSLALKAAEGVTDLNVRVVSMPSWELFERQDAAYRASVLPPACMRRLAVEAGSPFGWERYVGSGGATVCVNRYGASAPYKKLEEEFGFTVANVAARIRALRG